MASFNDKTTKAIIHRVGLKHNMTDEEIHELLMLSYKFLQININSGSKEELNYENIMMPGLGKFIVTEYKRDFWRNKNDAKEESGS
jgi:hypothetical protein